MTLEVFTFDQKPDLADRMDALTEHSWPRFLLHGDADNWGRLSDTFANYRILMCTSDETLVAVGHTVPVVWDGTLPDLPKTIGITRELGPR